MSPRNRILPVFIPHLGCPYHCVFCNQNAITGQDYSATAEMVNIELEQVGCRRYEACDSAPFEVAFYGGSFTAIPKEVQETLLSIVQPYRATGWVRSIRCSTRPDAISPDILQLLGRYGVETIELGCQSMDDDVLIKSGRGHKAEDVVRASRLIRDEGFHLILQMMTGLPGSDPDKDLQTARELIELDPDGVRIYPTVIIRNTPLFNMWKKGECEEHKVEDAVCICSRIVPMFLESGIPVIRLGLNPSDDLSGGTAAGGAYHPSFGELVYSRIMRNRAEQILQSRKMSGLVELHVSPSFVSKMTGNRKSNLDYLSRIFPDMEFRVIPDDSVPDWDVAIPLQKDWKNSIIY